MGRAIIVFLSPYREPDGVRVKASEYVTPSGETVIGTQTNDAPIKYLLGKSGADTVSKILCLVTEEAREQSFEHMKNIISEQNCLTTNVVDIPFSISAGMTDEVLSGIIAHLNGVDGVMLDVTGGPRNVNMEIVLLERVLEYIGITTECVVYSNFEDHCVTDITHLFKMFDLINGMHEFMDLGSVRTLKQHCNSLDDVMAQNLVAAMDGLCQSISLCRLGIVREKLDTFNERLREAEANTADPVMRALLPAFRKKIGAEDGTIDIPQLIEWCVNSNMLQQALTLYNECIPDYFIRSGRYVEVNSDSNRESCERTFFRLLTLSSTHSNPEEPLQYWKETIRNLEHWLQRSTYFTSKIEIAKLRRILVDYLFIRIVRNLVVHVSDSSRGSYQGCVSFLRDNGYGNPEQTVRNTESLKRRLLRSINHLDV